MADKFALFFFLPLVSLSSFPRHRLPRMGTYERCTDNKGDKEKPQGERKRFDCLHDEEDGVTFTCKINLSFSFQLAHLLDNGSNNGYYDLVACAYDMKRGVYGQKRKGENDKNFFFYQIKRI